MKVDRINDDLHLQYFCVVNKSPIDFMKIDHVCHCAIDPTPCQIRASLVSHTEIDLTIEILLWFVFSVCILASI